MKTITKEIIVAIIVSVFLFILEYFFKILTTKIVIPPIPGWIFILFLFMVTYPILVLIKFILTNKTTGSFVYKGVIWESSWWPYKYPMPACAEKGCGIRLISRVKESVLAGGNTKYYFICPVHGPIQLQVPHGLLQEAATNIRNKIREEQKK
jgi:hypothetical protein